VRRLRRQRSADLLSWYTLRTDAYALHKLRDTTLVTYLGRHNTIIWTNVLLMDVLWIAAVATDIGH